MSDSIIKVCYFFFFLMLLQFLQMTHIVNTRDFNLSFWVLVLRISNNVHLFCKHFFFFFLGKSIVVKIFHQVLSYLFLEVLFRLKGNILTISFFFICHPKKCEIILHMLLKVQSYLFEYLEPTVTNFFLIVDSTYFFPLVKWEPTKCIKTYV